MKNLFNSIIRKLRSLRRRLPDAIYVLSFKQAKVPIPFLVLITGQKCTLRCKDCGNFTPFLPQTFYDFDSIWQDFAKLLKVARISTLQIQGGEVLIYPHLVELLNRLGKSDIKQIVIATNGTRLLTPDQLTAIKQGNISVRISDYGVTQQRGSELLEQCRQNGIDGKLYSFIGADGFWFDLGGADVAPSPEKTASSTFQNCPFKACLTLEDGVLARCSRGTVSHLVQNFVPGPDDFLDVRGSELPLLKSAVGNYRYKSRPMTACNYCKGRAGEMIQPAIQLSSSDV